MSFAMIGDEMNHRSSAAIALILVIPVGVAGQDRLKTMAGYDAAQRVVREAPSAIKGAVTGVTWIDQGRAFEYDSDGKRYRYEIARGPCRGSRGPGGRRRRPCWPRPRLEFGGAGPRAAVSTRRCRQTGRLKAFYADRNVWISDADDRDAHTRSPPDGSVAGRIKYGNREAGSTARS